MKLCFFPGGQGTFHSNLVDPTNREKLFLHLHNWLRLFSTVVIFLRDQAKGQVELPDGVSVPTSNLIGRCRRLDWLLFPLVFRHVIQSSDLLYFGFINIALTGVLCKLLYHKPFVVSYTYVLSASLRQTGWRMQAILATWLEKIVFSWADVIIVGSPEIGEVVGRLLRRDRDKVWLRTHFVQTDLFAPKQDYALSRPARVLFVGRLVNREKNLSLLVNALAGLPDVELHVVGDGPDRQGMAELARESGVVAHMHGRLDSGAVSQMMRSCDLLCLVSPREGIPKVLLEAMSCGLPCVGTNVFGITWLLREGRGLLCEQDAEDLRSKIRQALADQSLREEIGRKARAYIEANHTVEAVMEQELNALNKALKLA